MKTDSNREEVLARPQNIDQNIACMQFTAFGNKSVFSTFLRKIATFSPPTPQIFENPFPSSPNQYLHQYRPWASSSLMQPDLSLPPKENGNTHALSLMMMTQAKVLMVFTMMTQAIVLMVFTMMTRVGKRQRPDRQPARRQCCRHC